MELVLSLFPGADLFGRAFELEGFCVVRGPEWFLGQDVRDFQPARHKFNGIVGGPPCQEFSKARRAGIPIKPFACDVTTRREFGYGVGMLREFVRIVTVAEPDWFLCENVPGVPDLHDVTHLGKEWKVQRIAINAWEVGSKQNRLRHVQFGSRDGVRLVIPRKVTIPEDQSQPTIVATGFRRVGAPSLEDACELQGLPRDFSMPGLSPEQTYKAVGNGVPLPMGRALAAAIREREARRWIESCLCGCGRPVDRGVTLKTDACRQRVSREQRAIDASQSRPVEMTFNL